MRDLHNKIKAVRGLSPVASAADNTAWVSQIVDRQGYEAMEWLILTGALPDADATFTVTMDHGDAANLSDAAAVPADQMVGTLAGASFIFSDDDKVFKVGYIGVKRYVRLTITPALNASASLYAAVAVLANPGQFPAT
jgi:hypothetical protein